MKEETYIKERLETLIKDYLIKDFGNDNALPKPVLNGIVDTIHNHRWEIHSLVQEEYDLEDINEVAEANEYTLTEDERSRVLHRYKKLDDGNLDLLYDIVDEVIKEREER